MAGKEYSSLTLNGKGHKKPLEIERILRNPANGQAFMNFNIFYFQFARTPGGGGTWVKFYWARSAGTSEPLPF